jgi:hypothetical protein
VQLLTAVAHPLCAHPHQEQQQQWPCLMALAEQLTGQHVFEVAAALQALTAKLQW